MKTLARAACAAAMLAACAAAPSRAAVQNLTILHDNDLHGHLRPFCYIEKAIGPQEHCDVGGAAKRATLITQLKSKSKAPVLVIDSGDTTTRGPLATQYEGVDEVEAMNAIGYDMAAIGNNEFKLKDAADINDSAGAQAALARLIRRSDFPWLCANATDAQGALLQGVQPYIVRQIGSLRIAFLGLTAPRSASYPQTKGLVITDPVSAAKIWIPRARAEADVLVAVTHIGVQDDQRLVKETRGIDVVVGGDSHTYLYKPVIEKNLDGQDVPIVQDGEFGVRLGKFDLTFEGDSQKGWKLANYADVLLPVDAKVAPSRSVAALVEGYAKPLDLIVGPVPQVGTTPVERTKLTAQQLAAAWKLAGGTEVGLQPEGDLFESFRTKSVTRFQVHAVLPFHDTIWKGQLSGARIQALLDKPSALGGAMYGALPPGPLDPNKTYSVATVTYVATAGGVTNGIDTGQDARDAAEKWLQTPH